MMIPPSVLFSRIRWDAAGVLRIAPCPTITRAAPFAAAIRRITCAARSLKYRPSPPSTKVFPAAPTTSKIDWTKFSR